MKKLLLSVTLCASIFALDIKVGATPVPHAEILEVAKKILSKDGHNLQIVEFNDYVLPNLAVDDDELDANFFQHKPYLDEFNKQKGTKLSPIVAVHLEPMGVYLKSIKNLSDLKENALVYIPNDPTNESRALDILAANGLISLDESVELKTPLDIVKNPKNLKFKELEAAQLPRVLDECDLAVINSNFALAANLNPSKDAVVLEDKNSPYSNIVVVKTSNVNNEKSQLLIKALKSDEVKKFIEEKYQGAIIPSF
ncbi:MetQ/NlpA family ABC transporter substrate-binding protein [Campylobacter canadensis]|uniref:MetQ/NlpA family ABC transporter substrate-binding protein n=1 Tax=Campylobacter canadensis TaxID=449520 RepID=UPI001CCAB0C1|nr:MetQ/NlpA family ABC transporter substrate-binding protein [Campylobacter canadensis]MBZ7993915.1 MetQ/NlpA family ABC transporter substrate-binding protein [Campylobacter canadensis]